MVKAKSKAIVRVPDGAGGMTRVEDRRFEAGAWPISFEVDGQDADLWLKCVNLECRARGWNSHSLGQLDAKENSASVTVNGGNSGQIAIVWERRRGGTMSVKARPVGTTSMTVVGAFLEAVNQRLQESAKEKFRKLWHLYYEGLPWRGELWLDESVRLCPPSRQYEDALIGPRVVVVDSQVVALDSLHAQEVFRLRLRELSVFLSVIMGTAVRVSPGGGHPTWTWSVDQQGHPVPNLQHVGYMEEQWPEEKRYVDAVQSVPLVPVQRPDFALRGIDGSRTEQWLPADVIDLWEAFKALPLNLRQQLLDVGSMWQLAAGLGQDHPTASYVLRIVACEALKPRTPAARESNTYDVVEALLGRETADALRRLEIKPHDVRNSHLHAAERRGDEFVENVTMSSFRDPTFMVEGQTIRQLTQAAIIEWLRRGGQIALPARPRRRRRWLRERPVYFLPPAFLLGLLIGIALG